MKFISGGQIKDAGAALIEAANKAFPAQGAFITLITHGPDDKEIRGASLNFMFELNGEPQLCSMPLDKPGIDKCIAFLKDVRKYAK